MNNMNTMNNGGGGNFNPNNRNTGYSNNYGGGIFGGLMSNPLTRHFTFRNIFDMGSWDSLLYGSMMGTGGMGMGGGYRPNMNQNQNQNQGMFGGVLPIMLTYRFMS